MFLILPHPYPHHQYFCANFDELWDLYFKKVGRYVVTYPDHPVTPPVTRTVSETQKVHTNNQTQPAQNMATLLGGGVGWGIWVATGKSASTEKTGVMHTAGCVYNHCVQKICLSGKQSLNEEDKIYYSTYINKCLHYIKENPVKVILKYITYIIINNCL